MRFIDAHCHLYAPELLKDEGSIISEAREVGVSGILVVSESVADFQVILDQVDRYRGFCFPCFGVHPVQASLRSVSVKDLDEALPLIDKYREKLFAIGEVGLDFTPWICKTDEEKSSQIEVFSRQVSLAIEYNLPLNIHSRSAAKHVVQILKDMAVEAARLGYHMSFPPHIINKPDRDKLIKSVPLENLLLETDSPALGPNKAEANRPSNITVSCAHIAKVKGIPPEAVAHSAWANTLTLFPKIKTHITSFNN